MYLRELLRTEVAKVKEEMYYELDRLDDKLDRCIRRLDTRLTHIEDVMNTLITGAVAMDTSMDPHVKSFVVGGGVGGERTALGARKTSMTPIYPGFLGAGLGGYDRTLREVDRGRQTSTLDEINVIYLQNGMTLDGLHMKEENGTADNREDAFLQEQREFEDGKLWLFMNFSCCSL